MNNKETKVEKLKKRTNKVTNSVVENVITSKMFDPLRMSITVPLYCLENMPTLINIIKSIKHMH